MIRRFVNRTLARFGYVKVEPEVVVAAERVASFLKGIAGYLQLVDARSYRTTMDHAQVMGILVAWLSQGRDINRGK